MPICPKCGKSFSSEQALCYHLNKKYKCGTWKCAKCNTVFPTKFALKIHTMSCEDYSIKSTPSFDILCKIYTHLHQVFLELDENDVIHSVSPAVTQLYGYTQEELIGKKSSDFLVLVGEHMYRTTKNGERVHIERETIDKHLVSERLC